MLQKYYFFSILILGILLHSYSVQAGSEPVCSYRNIDDETIFLTYMPRLRRGEDYVDFGKDGRCLKRAICTDTFKTEVEDCSKYKISCANKDRFSGVFPGCCVKC